MPWRELRTRFAQEVFKRLDLASYRIGIGPRKSKLNPRPAAHPGFFFDSNLEPGHRAALVRTHLPREAEAIVREAEEICRHEFRLLGCEKLLYGEDIDWHCARGKQIPLHPWFKINFLDFHSVGDHKVIWELNRHQHLVTLAKARLLTGNARYTNEIVAQFNSWQKTNPYPLGVNWASTLEVAFRSLSWLWVRNLLVNCPDLPSTFQPDLLQALQLHGKYIERYLSTYFSPNTHLLGEAVALFFIGTLCPEIDAAERWRKQGWGIVLQESVRQVRPDGVYFEQALYYHVYALDFFLHARILAAKNGCAIPAGFDSVLKKMLDVVEALSEVGPIEGFGDDDGGRLFNPRRNRAEHMTDPLAVGAVVYDRDKYPAANLTEEAIWLFGDDAVRKLEEPCVRPQAAARAFRSGGIYLINDDQHWAQQLMIDAGPQGTGHSGHGHADALSLRFSVNGQRFLVDPGTCCYISGGEERNEFRGTGAHNTLKVDNLDQAVPQGPFAWKSVPRVSAETWLNGQTFDFFVGSHDGYGRLPEPVLHRRSVFHVKGGLWLVLDVAEGRGNHLLESLWHFAPGIELKDERGMIFANSKVAGHKTEPSSMALLFDHSSGWTIELSDGFVSPTYGSKCPAPVLRASANASLPAAYGVLLLPMAEMTSTGSFATLSDSFKVNGYRYQARATTEFVFFSDGSTPWACGLWSSDSKLVYCKLENGRLTHVIMVAGTFVDWRGKRFVSQPSRSESFEWNNHSGPMKAFSPAGSMLDDSVVIDFEAVDSIS